MKYIVCLFLVSVICSVQNLSAQKKTEFSYPEDSVTDASKKEFAKHFNQGKILYNLTCSQCHNLKEGKKDIIPDFSLPQLMDYEMRTYIEHSDRLKDNKISDEEMNKVILFLRFKAKSGKTIKGEPTPTM